MDEPPARSGSKDPDQIRLLRRARDHHGHAATIEDRRPVRSAARDGQVVGRVSIRHELNDWLQTYGGHIGYAVRPAYRRRGIATEILRRSLPIARSAGLDRVLLICDESNVGSIRTIESCGGLLEGPGVEQDAVPTLRYWIDTPS